MITHVKKWFDMKGYDIFAHKDDILGKSGPFKRLLRDEKVECEVIDVERGRQVINIKRIV